MSKNPYELLELGPKEELQKITDVLIVLDRSGSMDSVKKSTIENYNEFIANQKKIPGECFITLIQFDDEIETVYLRQPVKKVKKLNENTFVPRGMTRLLDAIGKSIGILKSELKDVETQVIACILTDGGENDSQEFRGVDGRKQINEMIEGNRKSNWEFVFLGADQDAIAVGTSLGVSAGLSANITGSSSGMQRGMMNINYVVTNARTQGMDYIASASLNSLSVDDLKSAYVGGNEVGDKNE